VAAEKESAKATMSKSVLIEVCAGTLDDLEAACAAGADRVELNSGLPLGGLTPSPALLEEAVQLFPGKVIAMIRPRAGGFVYSAADWRVCLRDTELALAGGASGIAIGVLTATREIDVPRLTQLVRLAAGREVVFHRAFDLVSDWRLSLELLNEVGVHRVLTSGQAATAIAGAAVLSEMVSASRKMLIQVLAGSGIRAGNVRQLVLQTGVSQVHGTFSRLVPEPEYDSGPFRFAANDHLRTVDSTELKAARLELNELRD
jgi:copper homeostasis protein